MAGAMFCCCFCAICMVWLLGISLASFPFLTILYWGFWMGIYFCSGLSYLGLFAWVARYTHRSGIVLLRLKKEEKSTFKGKHLQTTISKMVTVILGHLTFLAVSLVLLYIFDAWYIKYPLILYICFIFGFLACFPIMDDELEVHLLENRNPANEKLIIKTVLNTLAFLGTFFSYSYFAK